MAEMLCEITQNIQYLVQLILLETGHSKGESESTYKSF